MTTSIGNQAIQRATNLPLGAVQNVVIDVTGQILTVSQQKAITNQIVTKSDGIIQPGQIKIDKSNPLAP